MRLIANAYFLIIGARDHQKAYVVMLVGIFDHAAFRIVSGGNLVHVDVEGHDDTVDWHDVEMREAGFFAGFAERDFFDEPMPVGMSAELQPAIELAMMRE